ncbi:MFS transporter [Actinoplanes sp. NEAU-A12]|uniref:MFS transporter n=1 Tax=Actinoplanes sandaracinus TaxID=3045177 RepID=A0ABT6WVB5_9ACTN|nr:MFS transporter [Actinoplanes sandaracinus]MDI6103688.1 MFS transporter [Actinoplanes sandaracinus]
MTRTAPFAGAAVVGARWQPAALALSTVGWGANSFTPLLGAYHRDAGLSATAGAVLFGVYAVGLIPALLWAGPAGDRHGHRRIVIAFVAVSGLATIMVMAGGHTPVVLAAGRLLTGVAAGAVFATATAWVTGLSADAGLAARRVSIALSAGFGAGPLAAALVATWTSAPLVTAYLPHLALIVVTLTWLSTTRHPGTPPQRPPPTPRRHRLPAILDSRAFRVTVVPMAPWVFGCATTAFAALPARTTPLSVLGAGLVTAVTLGAGTAAQMLARRLDPSAAALTGLGCAVAGLTVAATTVTGSVFVAAVALGAAYGLCLNAGLRTTEQLSDPAHRGAGTAMFLALTYLGFAAPWLLITASTIVTPTAALLGAAALAAATAAWLRTHHRHPDQPTTPAPTPKDPPMAALLILNYDVTDPDALNAYRTAAGPLLSAAAERIALTTDTIDLAEAGPAGTHTVIWRFPSVAAAHAFYHGSAYQSVLADRLAATTAKAAMIVETVAD